MPISTAHQPALLHRNTVRTSRPTTIGMLSTYPPTQCGLATFSAALIQHLHLSTGSLGVVQVVDQPEPRPGPDVVAQLVNGSPASAVDAVRRLNGFDAVVVQHEYGIYGGPDGARRGGPRRRADRADDHRAAHRAAGPDARRQRHILLRLLATADVVVTMTETAGRRLVASYGADPAQLAVIPHGAIDHGPRSLGSTAADRTARSSSPGG